MAPDRGWATTLLGAFGVLEGVTVVVASTPAPAALLATTDTVYSTPLVKPVMSAETSATPAVTQVGSPTAGTAQTSKPVNAEPPVNPADQPTVIVRSVPSADVIDTADGDVNGTTEPPDAPTDVP